MNKTSTIILAIYLNVIFIQLSPLIAEKLTQIQKQLYLKDIKYQEIVKNPKEHADKKVVIKLSFIETTKNNINIYKDLLPDTYELFNFEGSSDKLPVVFSNKNQYLNEILNSIQKHTMIFLYCDVKYRTSKDKEKNSSTIEKRFFLKVDDIEIETQEPISKNINEIDKDDFQFTTPIRVDIQHREMLDKKLKIPIHFSDIGQKLPPMIVKFTEKNDSEFFCLLSKEKLSLPLVASRKDENLISLLENIKGGDQIYVFAVIKKAENPTRKEDEEPVYYLDVIKLEKYQKE